MKLLLELQQSVYTIQYTPAQRCYWPRAFFSVGQLNCWSRMLEFLKNSVWGLRFGRLKSCHKIWLFCLNFEISLFHPSNQTAYKDDVETCDNSPMRSPPPHEGLQRVTRCWYKSYLAALLDLVGMARHPGNWLNGIIVPGLVVIYHLAPLISHLESATQRHQPWG